MTVSDANDALASYFGNEKALPVSNGLFRCHFTLAQVELPNGHSLSWIEE
jgi:hypothetical protein